MVDCNTIDDNREIMRSMLKIPALKSLERSELQELLGLSELRRYAPHEQIMSEGGHEGRIYYLISGKVKLAKRSKALIILQRSGDVFGEIEFLEGKASSASAYALGSVVCLALDISDIDQFSTQSRYALRYIVYREFAGILSNKLQMVSGELEKTRKKLENLELAFSLAVKDKELAQARAEFTALDPKYDS